MIFSCITCIYSSWTKHKVGSLAGQTYNNKIFFKLRLPDCDKHELYLVLAKRIVTRVLSRRQCLLCSAIQHHLHCIHPLFTLITIVCWWINQSQKANECIFSLQNTTLKKYQKLKRTCNVQSVCFQGLNFVCNKLKTVADIDF